MEISRFQLHRLMARYEIAPPKGEELDESPWAPGRCGIEDALVEWSDGTLS